MLCFGVIRSNSHEAVDTRTGQSYRAGKRSRQRGLVGFNLPQTRELETAACVWNSPARDITGPGLNVLGLLSIQVVAVAVFTVPLFRTVGDDRVAGQQQSRDAGCVLQAATHDFHRVDHA